MDQPTMRNDPELKNPQVAADSMQILTQTISPPLRLFILLPRCTTRLRYKKEFSSAIYGFRLERFAETRVCHRIVFFFLSPFFLFFYFSRCQFTWAAVKSTTVIRQPLSRNRFCTHKSTIFEKKKTKNKINTHFFCFLFPCVRGLSLSLIQHHRIYTTPVVKPLDEDNRKPFTFKLHRGTTLSQAARDAISQ